MSVDNGRAPAAAAEAKAPAKRTSKKTVTLASFKGSSGSSARPVKAVPAADEIAAVKVPEVVDPFTGSTSETIAMLQKHIRNYNKRLAQMQKLDSIFAENPDSSLDQLVEDRKINADQKAQALKKPFLVATVAQLEQHLTTIQRIEADLTARFDAEKAELEAEHKDQLERVRSEVEQSTTTAVWVEADAKITAAADEAARLAEENKKTKSTNREQVLTFSRFLRAAAAQRSHADPTAELTRAFEGLLLVAYGGDEPAVAAIDRLIQGSSDRVAATDGTLLDVSYDEVLQATLDTFRMAETEQAAKEVELAGREDGRFENQPSNEIAINREEANGAPLGQADMFGQSYSIGYAGVGDVGLADSAMVEDIASDGFAPDDGDSPPSGKLEDSPTDGRRGWRNNNNGNGNGNNYRAPYRPRGSAGRGDGRGRGWGRGRGRGGFRGDRGRGIA